MEKESKHFIKILIGLIIAVISFIGIPFTILHPFVLGVRLPIAADPIQLVLCVIFLVGIIILTKGLVENKFKKTYWLPLLLVGVLTIVSMFTPESYNRLVVQAPFLTEVSWLWDLKFLTFFQLTELFFLILVLVASGVIILISTISLNNHENIIKYTRVIKTMANILIISPVFLYFSKIMFSGTYFATSIITPGFALVGPFFMGVLTKFELRIYRKNLEISQDEFQRKRNKVGYAFTIVGVYILVTLSALIDRIGGAFFTILPANLVNFVLFVNLIVVIIAIFLALISIFWALFDPKWSIVLFVMTGITIAFIFLVVSWLYVFALILLAPDIYKTGKIARLAKQQ